MSNLFFDLPLTEESGIYNAVIEIPKNSRTKYEYSEKHGAIMVDRVVKVPVGYPQNYGFFPQSWNKYDADPMDVIVISNESFYPGVVAPVRIFGIIEMEDTGELDHKILAVPADEKAFENIKDLEDMKESSPQIIDELEWYLSHYKDLDKGKSVKILGIKGHAEAQQFLDECSAEYQQNHAK